MATNYYNLAGTVKWAKLNPSNKDIKYDPEGIYTVQFYPATADEWEKIKISGLQLGIRSDEDGEYISLRRKHEQQFGREFKIMGPPVLRHKGSDFTGLIGNGSSVVVNVAVFDTRKGKGHRLERVTITNLVEYNREKNTSEEIDDEIPF